MQIINWSLARQPVNYIIVLAMLLIPIAGWDLLYRYHATNYRPPNAQ